MAWEGIGTLPPNIAAPLLGAATKHRFFPGLVPPARIFPRGQDRQTLPSKPAIRPTSVHLSTTQTSSVPLRRWGLGHV